MNYYRTHSTVTLTDCAWELQINAFRFGALFLYAVLNVMNGLFPASNQYLFLTAYFGHRIFDVTHLLLIWQCEESSLLAVIMFIIANKISSMLNVTAKLTEKFALDNS